MRGNNERAGLAAGGERPVDRGVTIGANRKIPHVNLAFTAMKRYAAGETVVQSTSVRESGCRVPFCEKRRNTIGEVIDRRKNSTFHSKVSKRMAAVSWL